MRCCLELLVGAKRCFILLSSTAIPTSVISDGVPSGRELLHKI